MSHNNLQNYYMLNFSLIQHHKYSLTEIENMLPYELTIYTQMLSQHIKEENDKIEAEKRKM